MNNYTALARPYAHALFDLADEKKWQGLLQLISQLIESPDLLDLLDHPQVSKESLEKILIEVLKLEIQEQNFIKILIQNRQLVLVPEILKLFNQYISDSKKHVQAELQSPFILDINTLEEIKKILSEKFNQEFDLQFSLCPELIGGIKIKTAHWVIDNSLETQIKKLQKQLIQSHALLVHES